jgi:hypothetical protein
MARGIACAVAVLLVAWVAACGGGDDADTSLDPGSDDFTYESQAFDKGSKTDQKALLDQFRKVQRAFYEGDAEAVCATFDREYARFDLNQCVAKVDKVAGVVQDGEDHWPKHKIKWVRIYRGLAPDIDAIGGVTVIDADDEALRVGFVQRSGRWLSAFDVPGDLEGLNTELKAGS